MKMKTVGDIFTASSMGWGWGWVNIALTLQISFGGRGAGREKRMCTDWYAES